MQVRSHVGRSTARWRSWTADKVRVNQAPKPFQSASMAVIGYSILLKMMGTKCAAEYSKSKALYHHATDPPSTSDGVEDTIAHKKLENEVNWSI